MNKINLKITFSGFSEVDSSWHGNVVSPSDSRLYFILEGEFYIIAPNGEKTLLTHGNSYLIPSGYSYSYGCEKKMSHLFFHLSLSAFDGLDILSGVERPISCPFTSVPDGVLEFSSLVDSLYTESFLTSSLYSLLKQSGISLNPKRYSKEVKSAIEYIRRNLSVQLRICDIATESYSAPSTLTRNFRRETGMSIGEYIDLLVLQKAEYLLKTSDMSLFEISEALGFCDQFYFSRKFSEKYGVSPSKYRRFNVDI